MQKWSTVAGVVVMCLLLAGAVYLFMDTSPRSQPERIVVGSQETAGQPAAAAQQGQPQGQPPGGRRRGDGGGDQRRQFGPGGRDFRGPDGQQPGGPPLPFQRRESMTETMNILGETNLRPDFDLTKEQKEKIAAIRDGLRAAREKWQAERAEELRKIDEQMRAARDGGGGRDQFEALMQKRQEIMATAPSSEDAIAKIKAVLTPEQLKAFEAAVEERRRAEEEMRQRFGGFGGPGGGGPPFGGRGDRGRDDGGARPPAPPGGGREPGGAPGEAPQRPGAPAGEAPARQREI